MKEKKLATQARMMQIYAAIYKLAWIAVPLFVALPHKVFVAGCRMIVNSLEIPNKAEATFVLCWLAAGALGTFIIQLIVDAIYGKTKDGESWLYFAPRADSLFINVTNVLLVIEVISIIPMVLALAIHHIFTAILIAAVLAFFVTSVHNTVGKWLKKAAIFVLTCIVYIPVTIWERIKSKNII